MKNKNIRKITALGALILCILTLLLGATVAMADGEEKSYYVCFSSQNYAIRNSNKMTPTEDGGEYLLCDVSIGGDEEFYVSDGEGVKYCAFDGKNLTTDKDGRYSYTIRFNPTKKYTNDDPVYEKTDSHVTFGFYVPGEVVLAVSGGVSDSVGMNYNSYHTAYDLYYLSQIALSAGDKVSVGEESHTVGGSGYYRILYTPGEEREGDVYLFDGDGNYGSGEDYKYHLYLADAPRYFAVFESAITVHGSADTQINGKDAYLLSRFEDNVSGAEYRSVAFFSPECDFTLKYRIYEQTPSGGFVAIDDDGDEDTKVSGLEIGEVGNYQLSFLDGGDVFNTSVSRESYDHDGFYLLGNMNGWGFDAEGNLDLRDEYKFAPIEENDEDYDGDYDQYRLIIYFSEAALKDADAEFIITDGEVVYMNLFEHITVDKAGEYEILFSDEHDYGRGRNYRYTLLDGEREYGELVIRTVEEYIEFARACNRSAEYSENLIVYLACDLDFTGVDFLPIRSFSGILRGGYHKMSGITLNDSLSTLSVFGRVTRDGVIERLSVSLEVNAKNGDYVGFVGKNYGTLREIEVGGSILGSGYVGAVAAYNGRGAETTGATESAYVNGVIEKCISRATVSGFSIIGGLVGFNNGTVTDSESYAEVSGVSYTPNSTPINIGGISGYSAGRVENSRNFGRVGGGEVLLNVGGIAGQCTGDVYFSYNCGSVTGTKYVGGIVGYYGTVSEDDEDLGDFYGGISYEEFLNYFSDDDGEYEQIDGRTHAIYYSVNEGEVSARSSVGGIVGHSEAELPIASCISLGALSTASGGYLGGIVGYGPSTRITGSVSSARISATAAGGAGYVGGIVGHGGSVFYSASSSEISGGDFVGGIAGYIEGELRGCYTNVLIVANDNALNVGDIAGAAQSFNESFGNFGGSIEYNYYVGTAGGVGTLEYGESSDFAAKHIDSDALATVGELSELLHKGFSAEHWLGGGEQRSYPIPRGLVEAVECDYYDDEDGFEALFDKNKEKLTAHAEDVSRVFYYVSFLEWNKDKGDLYGDGGELLYDSFEVISCIRVYEGEELTEIPELKYAGRDGGRWYYEGGEAAYFVSFDAPVGPIGESLKVYADYAEVITTLADPESRVLLEGRFVRGTELSLVSTSRGYRIELTLDGVPVYYDDCRLKFRTEGEPRGYAAMLVLPEGEEALATSVSGKYLAFDISYGDVFEIYKDTVLVGEWWLYGAFAAAGAVLAGVGVGVVCAVRGRRRKSKENG